jgi:hypothetical protein
VSTNVSTTELSENSVIGFTAVTPGQFIAFKHRKADGVAIDYIEYHPLVGYGVVLCTSGEYTYTEIQPMFLGSECALVPSAEYVETHANSITMEIVDRAPEPSGPYGERVIRP